jgi:nesprin-1
MEQLEDAIQDHREFLMELDSHKSLMMSINVIGSHLAEHSKDPPKVDAMKVRLEAINKSWDETCEAATKWQTKLQTALLEVRLSNIYLKADNFMNQFTMPFFQNSEFHRTIEELTIWLEETTATIRSTEPVDLSQPQSILESKYSKFVQLHSDLQRCEPRIVSLQVNLPLIVMFHLQTNKNLSQSIYLGGRRSAGTSNGKPAMW